MAESVINFAVETMGNMLIEEAKFLHGVKDQVEDLQLDLDRLLSFLRDAESRQKEKDNLHVWISQTKDVVYEAEDLLESYAFKIASLRENIFKRSVCVAKECYIRRSIGSKIQRLQSKISGLTTRFEQLGIRAVMEREGSSSSSSVQQLRRTYSSIVEDDCIELDNDVEMLAEELVNDRQATVSIFGMGGLGKTTLARKIYQHSKVLSYFNNRAWVCISQQWQTKDILEGILIKFFPSRRDEITKWREEELVRELAQTLRNNVCLVVLDDIWSTEAWEAIKEAFPIANKGSKLLVTTRNKGVALQISPNDFHYEPRLLDDTESWKLLQIKALRKRIYTGGLEEMHKMEELGKEMVKHCGGLPLAIIVLGGILVTKRDIQEWESVHNNVKAFIGKGKNIAQEHGEVEKILALSYNDLPPKLKPCFLYLGRFPEDSDIEVERLFQLWMAEGMVLKKDQMGEESLMEVADRYLVELAERSMVQVKIDEDKLTMTRFKYCRLHDLMRDLILEKAREENFFLLVHSRNGFKVDQTYKSSSSTHQIHRLVVHFQEGLDVRKYVPPQKSMTEHLRSLTLLFPVGFLGLLSVPQTIKSHFSWSRMLRTLELDDLFRDDDDSLTEWCLVAIRDFQLSECLGNLVHLKCLSLRGCSLFLLSSSIGNMKCLQTIDLGGQVRLMPNVFWMMGQLKYMYLPRLFYDIRWGLKLRFDGLSKLEILEGFHSSTCSCKDLVKLTNLRQLEATLVVDVECEEDIMEIITFISKSKSLHHARLGVVFSLDGLENTSAFLTQLFSCQNLVQLRLIFCQNLPEYDVGFASSSLISVECLMTQIKDDPMKTLERLPNLKQLLLVINSFLGTEMQCRATGFPQLRDLQLMNLPNLEKWIVDEGAMPNLSTIRIETCLKLEMIPDGFRFITTLKELEVVDMPEKFNRRLQVIDGQEGEDFDKIRHVPFVKIIQ